MNKEEVATCLGVSVRAVERYTKDGKLSVVGYSPQPRGGQKAIYDPQEVDQLKIKMAEPRIIDVKERENKSDTGLVEIMSGKDQVSLLGQSEKFISNFEKLVNHVIKENGQVSVPIGEKLLLTLEEIAGLTSLSVVTVRKEIKQGTLKGVRIGRGWRVKREDLEVWVKGL